MRAYVEWLNTKAKNAKGEPLDPETKQGRVGALSSFWRDYLEHHQLVPKGSNPWRGHTFTEASGYTNIFHVFLPQGTDMCITPIDCYSPDIDSTFTFCAFHSSFDYNGEHLLFSVEPYQAVRGCAGPAPRVIDATASALSHEFFETITDPDGSAWFNGLVGYEMADVCVAFRDNVFMRSHNYVIQEEYSNAVHACTDGA